LRRSGEGVKGRCLPEIFLFSTTTFKYIYRGPLRRIGQDDSTKVAWWKYKSLKRVQPFPVCAGFFICIRRSGEGVKGRCLPWSKEEEGAYIFLMKQVSVPHTLFLNKEISILLAWWKYKSLKRVQPLPVCAGFFICIRNSLDRPCVAMPSWSSPLKCKVSHYIVTLPQDISLFDCHI
jgi:hypothetical protein